MSRQKAGARTLPRSFPQLYSHSDSPMIFPTLRTMKMPLSGNGLLMRRKGRCAWARATVPISRLEPPVLHRVRLHRHRHGRLHPPAAPARAQGRAFPRRRPQTVSQRIQHTRRCARANLRGAARRPARFNSKTLAFSRRVERSFRLYNCKPHPKPRGISSFPPSPRRNYSRSTPVRPRKSHAVSHLAQTLPAIQAQYGSKMSLLIDQEA